MIKSQKGITMAMVIFLMAVVFIVIAAIFSSNTNKTINVTRRAKADEALQIAEAGINAYIYQLSQNPEFFKDTEGVHIAGSNSEELGFVPMSYKNGLPEVYNVTAYKDNNNTVGYYQVRLVQPSLNNNYLEVISTGWTIYQPDIRRTISVKLRNNNFCDYLMFSKGDITFYTGITIKGPVFSNGNINIDGNPKFESDLISAGSIITKAGSPNFGGNNLTNQLKKFFPSYYRERIVEVADKSYEGRTCILLNNNSLRIRNQKKSDSLDTVYNISKSYVLYVDGPVFISGTWDGRLTVYSTGDIYITGKDPTNWLSYYATYPYYHLVYYLSPIDAAETGGLLYKDTSNSSDDILGLISEKNIIIATRSWPSSTDENGISKHDSRVATENMNVYGVLMTSKNIEVEDSFPFTFTLDTLNLYGSQAFGDTILQDQDNVERKSYSKITNTYDNRLRRFYYPPYFLNAEDSKWGIIAWKEVSNP